MTNPEKVIQYIEAHGSFTPAFCANKEIDGLFFGSEIARVCRKMRAEGVLVSERNGKFEVFELPVTTDRIYKLSKQLWKQATEDNYSDAVDRINAESLKMKEEVSSQSKPSTSQSKLL